MTINNGGGAIIANIKLIKGTKLNFVIGQQGESPCNTEYLRKQKIVNKSLILIL